MNGNSPELSSHILDLADEVGLDPNVPTAEQPAGAFERFRDRYRNWSPQRDQALAAHLKATPAVFRAHLPYSPRVFMRASELLWYVDELVVRDPVPGVLSPDGRMTEGMQDNLLQVLRVLCRFRPAIESGYLLLGGEAVLPPRPPQPPDVAEQLANQKDVVAALDAAVRFGMQVRQNDRGRDWAVTQTVLDHTFAVGFAPIKPLAGQTIRTPTFRVGEELPAASAEQVQARAGVDIRASARRLYPSEVSATLHTVAAASSMGAAVVFDRIADTTILAAAGASSHPSAQGEMSVQQAAVVGGFNLALPYLRDVSPDRLQDLREDMPESFRSFRAQLADMVRQAMASDPENADAIIRLEAERSLEPQLTALESDMNALAVRAGIFGMGIPTAAAFATLAAFSGGAALPLVLPLWLAGTTSVLKGIANHSTDAGRLRSSPLYFLWRARQEAAQ